MHRIDIFFFVTFQINASIFFHANYFTLINFFNERLKFGNIGADLRQRFVRIFFFFFNLRDHLAGFSHTDGTPAWIRREPFWRRFLWAVHGAHTFGTPLRPRDRIMIEYLTSERIFMHLGAAVLYVTVINYLDIHWCNFLCDSEMIKNLVCEMHYCVCNEKNYVMQHVLRLICMCVQCVWVISCFSYV